MTSKDFEKSEEAAGSALGSDDTERDSDSSAGTVGDLSPRTSGLYAFPDVRRRLIAAGCYAALGALLVLGGVVMSPPAYNRGFAVMGIALLLIAAYTAYTAWPLRVSEAEAVESAAAALGFAVGPASVSIGWRGLRSRPVWQILAYSHEAPPERRGLAIIDAVDGEVLTIIEEANPEDWGSDEDVVNAKLKPMPKSKRQTKPDLSLGKPRG